MEQSSVAERPRSIASTTRRSLTRAFSPRRSNDAPTTDIGQLGLSTVFHTDQANADLVFVHGLGGGSRKTWSKNEDPSLFWPGEWLSQDSDFQNVRIHTFGYESNWDKESILNIHDFAKSLLEWVTNCPTIPRNTNDPLILVCHSLGGLVAKRALVLAKQLNEYKTFASRLKWIFFLATPHRGSNFAETLSKILQVTPGARPFVSELQPNSAAIGAINDEFPRHCGDLQIYSFHETLPMSFGVKKGIIVPKESATLGYPNERSTYLKADHREVCKFSSVDDPNYQKIRNALAGALSFSKGTKSLETQHVSVEKQKYLREMLRVNDMHNEEYQRADALRVPGSCTWISQMTSYSRWKESVDASMFWLTANPGTGKSVLCSYVIDYLRGCGELCSFFFFTYTDKSKLNLSQFVHSMAWQMARLDANILDFLADTFEREPHLGHADARTLWRRLFLEGIFKLDLERTQYWVVDALDECKHPELVQWLLRAAETNAVRILVTCRNKLETYGESVPKSLHVESETIPSDSTRSDISLFLEANIETVAALELGSGESQGTVVDLILDKAAGCFLWVRVVLQELRGVFTEKEAYEVLKDVPTDMDELYTRIVHAMSAMPRGKGLAQAITTWAACSVRPLVIDELYDALHLDINEQIEGIPRAIAQTCGQLVQVDSNSRVQMVHQTARDFLMKPANKSEFHISKRDAHTRLASVCLYYLTGPEMAGPKPRKLSANTTPSKRCAFAKYACESFCEHIPFVSSQDNEFMKLLARFLTSPNVLSWIEWVATNSSLEKLMQAGRTIRAYSHRRARNTPNLGPLAKDAATIDAWSTDLVRLVTRFGARLTVLPTSIFQLIPAFCPSETAIRKQFGHKRALEVIGLSAGEWDDCMSTITHQKSAPLVLACGQNMFAVGLRDGEIKVYDENTCQRIRTINHEEPVHLLEFDEHGALLASASRKSIITWDVSNWDRVQKFDTETHCIALAFADAGRLLLGTLRNSQMLMWSTETGESELLPSCTDTFNNGDDDDDDSDGRFPPPTSVSFAEGGAHVAIAYRGRDILIWDVEEEEIFDVYSTESGSLGPNAFDITRTGSPNINKLTFSRGLERRLLAASTGDGLLIVFDLEQGIVQARTPANVHTMVASASGQTLATGNSSGTIQLWDFESLKLIHSIYSGDELGIRDLCFSVDGQRLIDIRGIHCRVWDPPALLRQEAIEDGSDTVSVSTVAQEQTADETELTLQITAVAYAEILNCIFCGRMDSSVAVYDASTGKAQKLLFNHKPGVVITLLEYDPETSILFSVDSSSQVMAHRIHKDDQDYLCGSPLLDHRAGAPIEQILCQQGGASFLLSCPLKDEVWLVHNDEMNCVASINWDQRQRDQWAPHPERPEQLILFESNHAHIFAWSDLERLSQLEGIDLEEPLLSDYAVSSVRACFSDRCFAVSFTPSSSRILPKHLLWNVMDLTESAVAATPVPHFERLSDKIDCIIGNWAGRLIFLDNDGWVCSTEPEKFSYGPSERHFFFPNDWLTGAGDLMIRVLRNGDIMLVQRHEIAIVKRGLEQSEHASLTGNGSAGGGGLGGLGFNKRPSLARSALSEPATMTGRKMGSLRSALRGRQRSTAAVEGRVAG